MERLRRDASRLGLALPDRIEATRLLIETAREDFGLRAWTGAGTDGILRIEWSEAMVGGGPELHGSVRDLEPRPDRWRARSAAIRHPGPERRWNTKQIGVAAYESARAEAAGADVEEVVLCDADDHIVEGSHTNLLIVTRDGDLQTPELSLGPVEGLGLAIVWERTLALRPGRPKRDSLRSARELMAVNAVRGIVPVVELDGFPIGRGEPGPWARRLRLLFDELDSLAPDTSRALPPVRAST